jgi:hypothetical protein
MNKVLVDVGGTTNFISGFPEDINLSIKKYVPLETDRRCILEKTVKLVVQNPL